MKHLHYLEIENFKLFGGKIRIDLDHPTTLIGPNNCGKTTALQAIALWSMAVKEWRLSRSDPLAQTRSSAHINRLSMVSIPVRQMRHLWHNMNVQEGGSDILMKIAAGVLHDGEIVPISVEFVCRDKDFAYCKPSEETLNRQAALKTAADLNVALLYPMSGIALEEPVFQPGWIAVQMGQGQTAHILRNMCLRMYQKDVDEWRAVVERMRRLFSVELLDPVEAPERGSVDLYYRQNIEERADEPFEISFAGRGLQQMLLILIYLHSHSRSVLLIDEPDAHLEILRQNQAYAILRRIADETESQVVLATHSEILFQEAMNRSLTLLQGKKAVNLSSAANAKSNVRDALKYYGSDHYVKALQRGYVLYVEGFTDIDILRELSGKIGHRASELWDERINIYYTQDNHPKSDMGLDVDLERIEEGFGMGIRQHFSILRRMIPDLRGLAVLDSNSRHREDFEDGNLRAVHWRRYEIENYIVSPETLLNYVRENGDLPLMMEPAREILDDMTLEQVFRGSEQDFSDWKRLEPNLSRLVWNAQAAQVKMSDFAEIFFRRVAEKTSSPMLLRKGELYKLIPYVDADSVDPEISEKLNLLADLFENAEPSE